MMPKTLFLYAAIFASQSSHFIHSFSPLTTTAGATTSTRRRTVSLEKMSASAACRNTPCIQSSTRKTHLYGYIEADSVDEELDPKAGGIGLAMDNAIIISGSVDGKGVAVARQIQHYSKVIPLDDSNMQDIKVLCKGEGIEIYKDPGEATIKSITLAPISAVENALMDAVQVGLESNEKMFVNFSGGDDLMLHEVLDGVQQMVEGLKVASGGDVEFRSLCEPSFPMEKCGVAAMVVGKTWSNGQVFFNEGKWYTVSEDDMVNGYDE